MNPNTIYLKQNRVGGGSFGTVYKGIIKSTGKAVAIKVIDFDATNDDIEAIVTEISLLSRMQSPLIVAYQDSLVWEAQLWIIMEYCSGGSSRALSHHDHYLSETHTAIIIKEVLRGLEYIHAENIIHRDIKGENLLLSNEGEVKIADFGLGDFLDSMTSLCAGTPYFMAPEILRRNASNEKADIWSLGITAIELACGSAPLEHVPVKKAVLLIPKLPPPRLPPGKFSSEFENFVETCLQHSSSSRPSAKALLAHPFMKAAQSTSLLKNLINGEAQPTVTTSSSVKTRIIDHTQPFTWSFKNLLKSRSMSRPSN